jgi:hypothetical protein
MNPVDLLELDDTPGCHLTDKQRLDTFERIWSALNDEERTWLKAICESR